MKLLLLLRNIKKGDKILSPFCIVALLALLFTSCEDKKNKVGALYTGPIEIVNDVQIKYSEQGKIKILMKTPRSQRFQNETQIFPDTVNISFYDSLSNVATKLRSDSGRYDKISDVYIVKGNVRVELIDKSQILNTSELNWSPRTKKIFTDKDVSIRTVGSPEVIYATGLDAEQDFTNIKFRQGRGTVKFSNSGPGGSPAANSAPSQ